jgi:hypothetical protein
MKIKDDAICTARYHANDAAQCFNAAYWDEFRREFHMTRAFEALELMAGALDVEIVKREPPGAALIETLSEAAQ